MIKKTPLTLIFNSSSGFHQGGNANDFDQITSYWRENGFEVESYEFCLQPSFDVMMHAILKRHQSAVSSGIVVVAGGDGTLNAVAHYLYHTDIVLGIIPMGTFNYVARLFNIPLDHMQAARLMCLGRIKSMHVSQINQHIYLNNASLGLYPLFIKNRERYNRKIGRLIINAYLSGLEVILRFRSRLKLNMKIDNKQYKVKTSLLFFGNNPLQWAEMKLQIAECARQGKIAAAVMSTDHAWSIWTSLYDLIRGQLEHAQDVRLFSAERVVIESQKKTLTVAIDGELIQVETPLHISVLKNALKLMVPAC